MTLSKQLLINIDIILFYKKNEFWATIIALVKQKCKGNSLINAWQN